MRSSQCKVFLLWKDQITYPFKIKRVENHKIVLDRALSEEVVQDLKKIKIFLQSKGHWKEYEALAPVKGRKAKEIYYSIAEESQEEFNQDFLLAV